MTSAGEPDVDRIASVQDTGQLRTLHLASSTIQSSMWVLKPDALDLEYTRLMMGFLAFRAHPDYIVMIGLGGGSLAKFCYRHLPQVRIDAVEISEEVIALRNEFRIPPDDARLRIVHADGAEFVRRSGDRPDILLVDGFGPHGVPDELCSQSFYDACHDRLAPDGIMVVNLHLNNDFLSDYKRRIRQAFNDAVFEVIDEEMCNSIVFACKGDLFLHTSDELAQRPAGLDREAWRQLMPSFQVIAASVSLL